MPRSQHPPELTALFAPLDGNTISCLLDHLDPEIIVERLQALERDASSLRLVLRAVRARRRHAERAAAVGGHGKGNGTANSTANSAATNGTGVPHDAA
jgi:hypothetical protein